jgi:hypothetical protein
LQFIHFIMIKKTTKVYREPQKYLQKYLEASRNVFVI